MTQINTSALKATTQAIATVANTVSSVFSTTTKTVGMLDALVTKSSDEQRKRHLKDAEIFHQNLAHELAHDVAELDRKAHEYCSKNPDLAEKYTETYKSFLSKLQPQKSSD